MKSATLREVMVKFLTKTKCSLVANSAVHEFKEYKVIIDKDGTKRYFKPNTGRFMKEL